jgi:hypothetical protein
MSPLNIHPEESAAVSKKKSNKNLKVFLGIGALIAIPVIGSTFAATINITNGPEINFGQGQVQAIACDADGVTVTAESIFENVADDEGDFRLGDVTVTGISDDCDGALFKVSIYNNVDDSDPLDFCGGIEMDIELEGDSGGGLCGSGAEEIEYSITNSEDDHSLTIQFGDADPAVASTNVSKVTLETS